MAEEIYRLLLVDDDPAVLRLYGAFLAKDGWEVETACDGEQAKTLIERRCPHVVLTDWNMPFVTGPELCRWIREQTLPNYVYTILLTAREHTVDVVQGLESGANDFLRKPIEREELRARARAGRRVVDLEQRLTRLTRIDGLTGLLNRKTFSEHLAAEWNRSKRHFFPLSCVMLDIDYFKRINDTHGHAAGDAAIKVVAETLRRHIRASDLLCRHGGEEFCVAMPETDEQCAVSWAMRVRKAIADQVVEFEDQKIRFTSSFGVAQRSVELTSPDQLVDMADQALLVAKAAGRDRVVGFQSMNQMPELQENDRGAASIFKNLLAKQVMTALVTGLHQDDTIGSAAEFFLRFRISFAPVVDDTGVLRGILSEKDMMALMMHSDWHLRKIRNVMKCNVVSYEESTPALQIYQFLCRVNLPGVMIVKEGRPTGLISRGSLLRWFANSVSCFDIPPPASDAPAVDPADTTVLGQQSVDSHERLVATAQVLADEAKRLVTRLEGDEEEIVPTVIGASTRMQEVINDLLAFSRYAETSVNDAPQDDTVQIGIAGLLNGMAGAEASVDLPWDSQ